MEQLDIVGATNGPPKVLLVDQTRNEGGFEYETSSYIFNRLASDNVSVATTSVVHANDTDALTSALTANDFNVLFVFAHGNAGAPDDDPSGDAGGICFGQSDFFSWQLYGEFLENLEDKTVVMCICEGMNVDSAWTLLQKKHALSLVGSSSSISANQARVFFPVFFDSLNQRSTSEISPDTIEECVEEHNPKVSNIMSLRYGS